MPGLDLAGQGGEQVDAERLGGELADLGHLDGQLVGRIVEAPSVPMPPASLTAATRRWYDTPPMPASITGCSMSSRSVSRVRIAATVPPASPATQAVRHAARSLAPHAIR